MNKIFLHLISACIVLIPLAGFCQTKSEFIIYNGKKLSPGFDMGVNTSQEQHNWLKNTGSALVMNYPANQDWGAVFVTVGKPKSTPTERQSRNFSTFDSLIISMKGAKGGEQVDIGIKDKTDPDNGSETKKTVTLSTEYNQYQFALKDFTTADLQNLYVVTEFVFGANSPCTISVNAIKVK